MTTALATLDVPFTHVGAIPGTYETCNPWASAATRESIYPILVPEPFYTVDYLGTLWSNDEPSRNYEERRNRCYELCGYALAMSDEVPAATRMVHGSWTGPAYFRASRKGHAWLELPPVVPGGPKRAWEPIRGHLYTSLAAFVSYTLARDERTYDRMTTRRMIAENGHYGRWHESRYL